MAVSFLLEFWKEKKIKQLLKEEVCGSMSSHRLDLSVVVHLLPWSGYSLFLSHEFFSCCCASFAVVQSLSNCRCLRFIHPLLLEQSLLCVFILSVVVRTTAVVCIPFHVVAVHYFCCQFSIFFLLFARLNDFIFLYDVVVLYLID